MKHRGQIRLIFPLLLGLLGFSLPIQAQTCDCTPLTAVQAQDSADIIFTGTCIQVESNWISGGMKFAFQVDQYWKKSVDQLFIVKTPFQKDCGVPFEEGKEYLVYVRKKFSPKTDICMGTKERDIADADLVLLGEGSTPKPSSLIMPMYITIGGLCFLAMGILAFAVLKRKPKNT